MQVSEREEINENADTIALREGLGIIAVKNQLVQEEQEAISLNQVASLKGDKQQEI